MACREAFESGRMVQFLLQDPEEVLYHHEPILRDGERVGHLTSGNYGHTLGGAVGMGYVCNVRPQSKKNARLIDCNPSST